MKTTLVIATAACCVLFAIGWLAVLENAAQEKDDKIAVRPLKFATKDFTLIGRIGGQNKVTTLADAAAVEKLLGKDAAKGLGDQVDFEKEQIVLVSWSTGGPPDGVLKHETKGTGKDRKLNFFVQGPAGAKVRGERLRLGADFFAVPRDVAVSFDPKERN
jgi:hypothetical protein